MKHKNNGSKRRFVSCLRNESDNAGSRALPLSVPAGPFIDSACKFMRLAGRNFADLIGVEYPSNRPTLHRMLAQLQGWKRSWTAAAADAFAPHFGCDAEPLAEFLVGAAPAPNMACSVAAEYEFQPAASLAPRFISSTGFLLCGSITLVSHDIPFFLLPEIPRKKVLEVLKNRSSKIHHANLESLEALASEQHDALMATRPSYHHFSIDQNAFSSLVRSEAPYNTLDAGDRIDVFGFLLHDVCLGGRGSISLPRLSHIALNGARENLSQFSQVQRLDSGWVFAQSPRNYLFGLASLDGFIPGGVVEQHDKLLMQIRAMNLAERQPQRAIRILRRLLERAKK